MDSSIVDGLEALWAAGYETVYSCGGDSGPASPGYDEPMRGYISFVSVSPEQLKVLERAALLAETPLEHHGTDKDPRKVLRFKHSAAKAVFGVLLRG